MVLITFVEIAVMIAVREHVMVLVLLNVLAVMVLPVNVVIKDGPPDTILLTVIVEFTRSILVLAVSAVRRIVEA